MITFMPKTSMQVLKRSEKTEKLLVEKITDSIFLAAQDVGGTDKELAHKLAEEVVVKLDKQYGRIKQVSSAEIGNMVEKMLLSLGHYKTAKAYIINREKKRQAEATKRSLGVMDEVGLSYNALVVVKEKYLKRDADGETIESIGEMMKRVAKKVASAELTKNRKKWRSEFVRVMQEKLFLPGGRTLANAGTKNNQLANCFVMPMPDDIEGIFESLKESSILKKYGGGVGFSFGHIRPKGDTVSTTSGAAAGPVALMSLINDASEIYMQAGKRRGGNMVTLPVSHPDILEFVHCKEGGANLAQINYSISVTRKFMLAARKNRDWKLVNPRTGKVVNTINAQTLLETAARLAWKTGDPGIIFVDRINQDNPTPHVGVLETVNLCGEQPLLSYEACNLGSVNLAEHVDGSEVDWKKLAGTVKTAVRFLDDVVSVCEYPLTEVAKTVRGNRKIGLGVMGWADMLVKLGVSYGSKKSIKMAEEVMKFVTTTGHKESEKLGKEKGSFPNYKGSSWEKKGYKHFRNATVTTIAPTGTISMMLSASGGIEPLFALAYYRKSMGEYNLLEVNPELTRAIKHVNGLYSTELMDRIARSGSIQGIEEIPAKIREVFVTSMDITPEQHVRMLAAFQKYTDNAVSKTINMPSSATVEDVLSVYQLASDLKCKGLTVYRDGSRDGQVLTVGGSVDSVNAVDSVDSVKTRTRKLENWKTEKQGICPNCDGKLAIEEGCKKCYGCGYSVCG